MSKSPFLHIHCPQCGAELKYGGKKFACGACGYSRKLGDQKPGDKGDVVVERPLTEGLNLAAFERGLGIDHVVYECCKVKIAAPRPKENHPPKTKENKENYTCPFCNEKDKDLAPLTEEIKVVRPYGIVPFTIPAQRAPGHFQKLFRSTPWFFRAKGFASIYDPKRVRAIYVPVFTFDALTRSVWKAESGYNDIFPADYQGKEVKEKPRTRWEKSSGYLEHNFVSVMQSGSAKVNGEAYKELKIESLTGEIVEDYDPLYVREFECELYAGEEKKAFEAADKAMNDQIKEWAIGAIPGDANRELKIVSEKLALSFKHVLMPVWVSGFHYRGAEHLFFLNGRNGRTYGKPPLSWEKVAGVIAAGVILLILLVLGVDQMRS